MSVEQLRDELAGAVAAAPASQAAAVQHGDVTITVTGMSRARVTWPDRSELSTVTIATPDGQVRQLRGEEIASWDDLAKRVAAAQEEWEADVSAALHELGRRQQTLDRLEREATRARARRDQVLAQARDLGVTAYRMAKTLRVAESTVGRALKRLS